MTNNELLLAMSNMMDNKLQPIKKDLQSVKTELETVKDDVQSVKAELVTVKDDVQSVKTELKTVKDDVQTLKKELVTVKDNVQILHAGLQIVQKEVHEVKLYQENITLPRLNTIESCYTDTYKRYKEYADKMDSAFADIELVKQVVSEHSEKLQNIS